LGGAPTHWSWAARICGAWLATAIVLSAAGCALDGDRAPDGDEAPPVAIAVEPRPYGGCAYDSFDCNPAIDDVAGQVARLDDRGEVLGFHRGVAGDPSRSQHWQSIQRLAGPASNYLVATRSTEDAADADLAIAHLASRDTSGARLRSNRVDSDLPPSYVAPPSDDRVVANRHADTDHTHAGGTQLLGRVLAVPLERDADGTQVELFDLTNPETPSSISLVAHVVPEGASSEAGTASLAKLACGRYLLVVGRSDARILDFYVSTGSSIRASAWIFVDSWHRDEIETAIGDDTFAAYQNLQLVGGTDDRLYLIGTHHDWVDAFLVENPAAADGYTDVSLTKLAKHRLACTQGAVECDLDAGGGIYIDPAGALIVYGIEHANDGPAGSIRMMEFHGEH
jgi:hypothetical protein